MTMSIDQLTAVCDDLIHTLDIIRAVVSSMEADRAADALQFRRTYLRDIRVLLERT